MQPKSAAAHLDFKELVETYYQPLYRFAYSLAKNETDAGDLTQQTFLIWAEKGSSLRDGSKVKSWLFTTLYREFLRVNRRSHFQADNDPSEMETAEMAISPDVVNSTDATYAMEALQEVEELYRAPLSLFYLEDLSYKEIAEALDVPIGTVMSRLSRGKSQLKRILLKKG